MVVELFVVGCGMVVVFLVVGCGVVVVCLVVDCGLVVDFLDGVTTSRMDGNGFVVVSVS